MDAICRREGYDRLCANGFGVVRRLPRGGTRCGRQITISSTLQAVRSTKRPPIKSHKAPLEYKPRASPAPPPPPPLKRANPLKYRTIPLIGMGISAFVFSMYGVFLCIQFTGDAPTSVPTEPSDQVDVSSRYDAIARTFDIEMDSTEWWMGLPKMRRRLASQAFGDVLEVSIGTGRNLEYYDWDFKGNNSVGKLSGKRGKVRSLTAVDKSGEMLEIAHEKFSTLFPGILGVRWIVGDASKDIPPPPRNANERSGNLEGKKYDTIVQTMGLCSAADPVALLKNLGNWVEEEDGRILLLEHGKGKWAWLNNYLDRLAEGRAKKIGCWWNRNIDQIVNESGLEILNIETRHGGTTWWIELKKPKVNHAQKTEDKMVPKLLQEVVEKKQAKRSGWW